MIMRALRTLAGVLLIPAAVGTAIAFYSSMRGIGAEDGVLLVMERGVLCYLLIHAFVMRPVYLYVLGHEFVHVLATWICGGKVERFRVTPSGGSVTTSKTNFFIELSPYFVPIYTIMIAPFFWLLERSANAGTFGPEIFVFLIGFTLAFHFVMTSDALKIRQSDVAKSGILFSAVLIFIANLVIVMAVFGPLFEQLSFVYFIKDAAANSGEMYMRIYDRSRLFIENLQLFI